MDERIIRRALFSGFDFRQLAARGSRGLDALSYGSGLGYPVMSRQVLLEAGYMRHDLCLP